MTKLNSCENFIQSPCLQTVTKLELNESAVGPGCGGGDVLVGAYRKT